MAERRERTGVMLAKPFEERLLRMMPQRVVFQPKLNGARIRAVWDIAYAGYVLFSSTGRQIPSLPHVQMALTDFGKRFMQTNCIPPTLDGEAYKHGMSLQNIMSIVSKTRRVDPEFEQIQYHIFDMITDQHQGERVHMMKLGFMDNLFESGVCVRVRSNIAPQSAWPYYLSEHMAEGYEGIIIRDPTKPYLYGKQSCILKLKPTQLDEYTIFGVEEAVSIEGEPKGMVGAFDLIDSLGNHFQAAAGRLNHAERTAIWQNRADVIGKTCVVKYLELTDRGVPREPVTMEIK